MSAPLERARLLTIVEVAARLRISKRSAYRVAREMIHAEIGGRLLVPEPALERYIETRLRAPTWDPSAPASPAARTSRAPASTSRPTAATPSSSRRPIVVRTKPKP
ncbi:MAG: helix-turn-helix domain-containing protein [Proteobacteria bacterium]|nr:helix-turn-helix domain-containing protein [Pseudomonadota bacterium]